MRCTFCFGSEAVVYLDCYCLFCLECYAKYEREFEAARRQNLGRQAVCAYCSRKTMYKRCDVRVPADAATVKELTLDPRKASLRAAETFQFYLLHAKKQAQFYESKCAFMEKVIDCLILRGRIADLTFSDDIAQLDSFGFLEKLQQSHQSFTMDNLKPISFFQTQNLIEEAPPMRPHPHPHLPPPPGKQPAADRPLRPPQRATVELVVAEDHRLAPSEDLAKGASLFAFKSVKKNAQGQIGNSSNRQNRYTLQNQLLESTNCVTPLIPRKKF